MSTQPPKPKFDFDNAGNIKLKVKQLEEGIVRAQSNFELFTAEAQKQIVLKAQLMEELAQLKLRAEREGIKLEETN